MTTQNPNAPLTVYMLADHLDAALAAGEDLVDAGRAFVDAMSAVGPTSPSPTVQRDLAEDVRGFELMLLARTLRARDHARDLGELDAGFRPLAKLFVAGTAELVDAAEEAGDARGIDFETGDAIHAYLRSRGLITDIAATFTNVEQLTIDDGFRVAKRISLGALLDLVSALLDALDTNYDLFAGAPEQPNLDGGGDHQDLKKPRSLVDALDHMSLN